MTLFKKTCFECGAKVDKLYDGKCSTCIKEQYPPIYEIKPLNFKICNFTKKISYNNYYYEEDGLKKILPDIVRKNLVLNSQYELRNTSIENFEVEGHKVSFDVEVDCVLKE